MADFRAGVPISIHFVHAGVAYDLDAAAGATFSISNAAAASAFWTQYQPRTEPDDRIIWPTPSATPASVLAAHNGDQRAADLEWSRTGENNPPTWRGIANADRVLALIPGLEQV